ncbi:dockerin type I domain-containing protein, partial [Candidatus Marinimicrobia bacterium]|nr:dockerin type I domain-containing protein [Candidatus Neomarinimicrobiota bacterium]
SCNSQGTVIVTFQVDMTNESVGGGDGECGVHIGGDFNFFDWWSDELTNQDNDNIWKTSIILNSGDQIQYKFANCGSFGIESVPQECSVGQDQNRFIVVPNQDIFIDPVCFGGCDSECGELDYSQVTFSVDMREVETSSTGVYVSGQNLQGPSGLALSDDNQDDIWTLTTPLPYGEYTYKFRNGYYDEWDSEGWEDVSLISDCSYGEFNDRIVVVDTPVVDAGSFCFQSCQTCSSSALLGDVNEDNNVDVLDIVLIVNSIISTTSQPNNADVNSDGSVDVLDIVMIVGWIVD